jgi:hypothetical protein
VEPWFGPKQPGYELGIYSWQGYAATALFLIFLVGPRFVHFQALGLPLWFGAAVRIADGLIFLPLVYLKYDRG